MHVFAAQKAFTLFTKLSIKPDSPSLADEIAVPRPDMNIKVAAFTVSEKSINIKIKNQTKIKIHIKNECLVYLHCLPVRTHPSARNISLVCAGRLW